MPERRRTKYDIYADIIKIILKSGAHADNIYGENVIIESDCQISGDIQYTNELKIEENVSLSKQANFPNKN
ncbi:MAG: hypothetical protein QXX51_00475 [Candidatus Bathyarchaeia archaeon]